MMDIGTNSMRLLVVRINQNGSYATLTQQKESIRLGDGEFEDHKIQPEALERAVLVGGQFARMARSFGATEIHAVATSATREASNRSELISGFRDKGGFDARIISGKEEGRLIYLGVSSGVRLDDQRGLFVDIGGGSTEVIVGDRQDCALIDSMRLGAIRLSNQFFPSGNREPVSKRTYTRIQDFVRNTSVRTLQKLRKQQFDMVIGSSGTITTLGELAARTFFGRPREKDDRFDRQQIKKVIREVASMTADERVRIAGVSEKRADILVAGAAIFDTLMDELSPDTIMVSDRTLRDGLLIDYLSRSGLDEHVPASSYRMHSVLRLGRQCQFDEAHANQVGRLALEMFDSARECGLHDLGGWERELLHYAALLHDIGGFLSYSDHRSHSYYFIRNAQLLGFDETEVMIVATTALFHKRTYPRKQHPEFCALDEPNQRIVRNLCVFLKIAECLDRSHASAVSHAWLLLTDDSKNAELLIESAVDCDLELWAVEAHRKSFKRSFGVDFTVRRGQTLEAVRPLAALP
jgi:exopolyphosphatase/guanosine-5'-triphosphate,3'-diphosphate pyrophosphatase